MGYGVCMKVTFELPDPLVERLRARVPSGKRSWFVAESLEKTLRAGDPLEAAAKKANKFHAVNREMKAWEALNVHDD